MFFCVFYTCDKLMNSFDHAHTLFWMDYYKHFIYLIVYILKFVTDLFFFYYSYTDSTLMHKQEMLSGSAPVRRRPLMSVAVELSGKFNNQTRHIPPDLLEHVGWKFNQTLHIPPDLLEHVGWKFNQTRHIPPDLLEHVDWKFNQTRHIPPDLLEHVGWKQNM